MDNTPELAELVEQLIEAVDACSEVNDNRAEVRRLDVAVGAACLRAGIAVPSVDMDEPWMSPFGQTRIPHWSGTFPSTEADEDSRFVVYHFGTHNWRQAMMALALAAGAANGTGDTSGGAPPGTDDEPTALTKGAAATLRYLRKMFPEVVTLDDIEVGAGVSRTTAKNACDELIQAKYAHRPCGPNRGIVATAGGLMVADKLSTK